MVRAQNGGECGAIFFRPPVTTGKSNGWFGKSNANFARFFADLGGIKKAVTSGLIGRRHLCFLVVRGAIAFQPKAEAPPLRTDWHSARRRGRSSFSLIARPAPRRPLHTIDELHSPLDRSAFAASLPETALRTGVGAGTCSLQIDRSTWRPRSRGRPPLERPRREPGRAAEFLIGQRKTPAEPGGGKRVRPELSTGPVVHFYARSSHEPR